MSLQISHGKYTLFLAGHFVRFRACSHISDEHMIYCEFLLLTHKCCIF